MGMTSHIEQASTRLSNYFALLPEYHCSGFSDDTLFIYLKKPINCKTINETLFLVDLHNIGFEGYKVIIDVIGEVKPLKSQD